MANDVLNKSDYWKKKCLDVVLRGQAFTPPPKVYLALYTSNPTAADSGSEVVGGGYARREITFSAAVTVPAVVGGSTVGTEGTVSNTAAIEFPQATADWGLISHVGIRDALTGGNLLYFGVNTKPRTAYEADIIRFNAGDLKVFEG